MTLPGGDLRIAWRESDDHVLMTGPVELEIERVGSELRIRPARRPLAGVLTKFAQFGPDFMREGRGDQEQTERESL